MGADKPAGGAGHPPATDPVPGTRQAPASPAPRPRPPAPGLPGAATGAGSAGRPAQPQHLPSLTPRTAAASPAPGLPPSQHARHASLRIRTDSAGHEAAPARQPQSARGPGPHSDVRPPPAPAPIVPSATESAAGSAPRPAIDGMSPVVIKRTTSFSQRIHNFLHRDRPHRHAPPATPTIAYRTPTTQTQSAATSANPSATVSADNSPPAGASPCASSANMAGDFATATATARPPAPAPAPAPDPGPYRPQRTHRPVPDSKVFAVSQASLRSVNPRGSQIDQVTASMRRLSSMAGAPPPGHPVSREPSQNTLHQPHPPPPPLPPPPPPEEAPSAAAAGAEPRSPAAGEPESEPGSVLAGKTLLAKPPHAASRDADSDTDGDGAPASPGPRERLAAGASRDLSATAHKKAAPVYSTHKATLNQFGRQTKVIGAGTGGTVRLLQGATLDARPPSLRSGPPSSHHGDDDPCAYAPCEHKLFAVKEFRKRRADETPRAYMKKVTSEFCIGSSIHHENVIETLDLIFEGERVYEIMEYCPHDLFTFVASANMGLDETFCWFKQVCQGVQYLHRIGIAHRDLKLENCLLTDHGIVKIIDFGCATVYKTPFQKEPSQVVGVTGSDPYIAPEVLLSRRQLPYYAHTADIWSVGIMYMCMTLLKFPWRIADTETDRSYGAYIRDWPRGREKLFAQLPTLRHDGKSVIEGMVYPDAKGRLTMDQVMDSRWMKEIDVCHATYAAKSHAHHMEVT
ncbi:serine/threonine protein kinase [Coemansia javaensis]|uniref:Serine/threonine protein kinase n=1 Tax=Coemansia javaensis TaxID=2761396 RepID=A0A9W8H9J7_9FUNG|nr:serine/threonine protein kinase [Coemansia javaensis]